jgi:lipopolysaccharide biosynthesis regulator YciM
MKGFFLVFCISIANVGLSNRIDSLENALKTAQGEARVKTLNELFRAYVNSDPVKATGYTQEALTLATQIDDKKGQAACYNNLGIVYRNQGALDRALEFYTQSLAINESIANKEGVASTKNNIGNIYTLKKDYGQAMKYFEESHEVFSELGDQNKIIGSMINLGNLHSELQLYEQALKYFSQASQLSIKAGIPNAEPINNLGNLFFRQGNYPRAVEHYEKALSIAKKENNRIMVLTILANLGEVYARAGQGAKAQHYLDSALVMTEELQATLFEPQIYKSLSTNYAKQGKMKEAYETMLHYDQVREKIYGEESSRKIAQMQMALNIQEKEKEVDQLRQKDVIQSLELQHTRLVIALILLASIVLVAGLNLFVGRRRKNRSVDGSY